MQTPAQTQSAGMALKDRLELLVNNELFADVVFSVGTEGTLMYGHKAVLTMASDVFRAQFTGSFRESRENGQEHEILVIDIEPPVFKEILRHVYCDEVSITANNVLHLLYAAEKYLLAKLTKECTEFVEKHLSEENVLQIFVQNRNYELEDINRKCLNIVCANPIWMFTYEHFLTLDSKSLELIVTSKRMNCQLTHLISAIELWLKVNDHDAARGNEILSMVQKRTQPNHMCKYLYNFSSGLYKAKINCVMHINADTPLHIHGIGIALKSQAAEQKRVSLNVSIKHTGVKSTNPEIVKSMDVNVYEVEQVLPIMFERQSVDRHHGLLIAVQIGNADWPMYTMVDFTADNPSVGLRISNSTVASAAAIPSRKKMFKTNCVQYGEAKRTNCVRYVLYTGNTPINTRSCTDSTDSDTDCEI